MADGYSVAVKWTIDRLSIAAAIVACTCNLLSSVLLNYHKYIEDIWFQHRAVIMNYPYSAAEMHYPEIISQCILLIPLLVVIVFRRLAAVTFVYALILAAILAGRIYYLVQFYFGGISSSPKFTWADLLLNLLGIGSLGILVVWATIRLVAFVGNFLKSRGRGGADG
jgi:hypothetical protein